MKPQPTAPEHDTFILRKEEKINGGRKTRTILFAQCQCGFRTDRVLVRRSSNTRGFCALKTAVKEAEQVVLRQYLSHLNGKGPD